MALRLFKASCSSFPHLQGISLQINWYKDDAILAKSGTNLRSKFTLPGRTAVPVHWWVRLPLWWFLLSQLKYPCPGRQLGVAWNGTCWGSTWVHITVIAVKHDEDSPGGFHLFPQRSLCRHYKHNNLEGLSTRFQLCVKKWIRHLWLRKVRRLCWYRPWWVLMVAYSLLSGVSSSWWYAWDISILVKRFPPNHLHNSSSRLGSLPSFPNKWRHEANCKKKEDY